MTTLYNRGSARLGTLILPFVTVLFLALIGEGVFRLLGYGKVVHYDHSAELGWVNRPHQNTRTVGGWSVRTSSAGFRDREYRRTKPGGVLRILLVGDSFTFGYGVAEDSTYGKQLERLLRRAGPSCEGVQVINAGVNGYNTLQEVAFVRVIGIEYAPDIVLVGFTPNDIMGAAEAKTMLRFPLLRKLLAESALYQFFAPRTKAVLLRKQRRAYEETMSKFLQLPDSAVLARWQQVRAALADLQAIAKQHSFQPVVVVLPSERQVLGTEGTSPQKLFRALETETGLPVVDLLPPLIQAADQGASLFLDEPTRHPSPSGHAVAARELYRFLGREGFCQSAPDQPKKNQTSIQ